MTWYYFHLAGETFARDFFSGAFANDDEAKREGEIMAAAFRVDLPDLCGGSYIAMTNEDGKEITRFLLSTTH